MRRLFKKHLGKIVVLTIFFFGVSSVDASVTIGRVKLINLDTEANLIGRWDFDASNISGSTAEDSNPTATKNNGTMTGTFLAAGILSQARIFNGTSDYISMGNVLNMGTNNWTASAWIKTTGTSLMGVINKSLAGAQTGRWGIYLNNAGNNINCLSTNNSDGSGVVAAVTTTTHQNGSWHLVTCTWNRSGNLTLYLDGVSKATTDISSYSSANFSTTDTLFVGSYVNNSGTTPANYFNGKLDDVRVYNRALSANEVARLYTQGTRAVTVAKPKPNTSTLANGLTGWWTFDGADTANSSGVTSFIDKTGNGYVATSSSIKLIPGKIGQAAATNGTSQFISINHNATLFPATTMSISLWCYIPDLTGVSSCTISKQSVTAKNGFVITYSIGSDKKFYWRTGDGSAIFPANSCNSSAITQPGWYHIVGVHNGTTEHSLYVNGQLASCSITLLTLAQNALQLWMGRNLPNGSFFTTIVDDVRVYNRALTATDAYQLYTQGLRNITVAKPKPVAVNLSTNLVGWWTFDGKDCGTTYCIDKSTSGYTATLGSGVMFGVGKIGQATIYGGAQNTTVPQATNINSFTAQTVSAWVKFATSTDNQIILQKTNNNNNVYQLDLSGGNFRYIAAATSVATTTVTSTTAPIINRWYHLTGVYDGAKTYLYVNGVLDGTVGTLTGTLDTSTTNSLYLGSTFDPATYLAGAIDDVRIYSRALSTFEIRQLYRLGL